jgi:hypothetical protein
VQLQSTYSVIRWWFDKLTTNGFSLFTLSFSKGRHIANSSPDCAPGSGDETKDDLDINIVEGAPCAEAMQLFMPWKRKGLAT